MPVSSEEVIIGPGPTLVPIRDADAPYNRGKSLALRFPPGTDPSVYIFTGGDDVTPANGFPIYASEGFPIDLDPNEQMYFCTNGGNQPMRVLRRGGTKS